MFAKKCDRCESFYEESSLKGVTVLGRQIQRIFLYTSGVSPDLCQNCLNEFSNWMNVYKNPINKDEEDE